MGDWIIDQLLCLNKGVPHARMVLDIILCDLTHSFPRICKLNEFIL